MLRRANMGIKMARSSTKKKAKTVTMRMGKSSDPISNC
jgi:hypothetical protein